jgi:predicted Zn-dependent peptidase
MQLTVGLQPAEGVDLLSASDALGKYFADLAARGIDAPTLERLKKRIAGRWSEQEADPSETAQALVTWFASISSYEQFQQRRQALDAVTVDDVAALLRALAGPGRRVAGSLRPL